jgi:acyl carrier protein
MDDLERSLNDVFREVFDQDDLQVSRSTTAADVAGWDSLKHIDLIVAVEDRFGVRFKTAEVARLDDVGALIDLLRAKLGR